MNSRTQELTFGAMIIAVFGVILVLNRQTAGLFEELFFFILPIPMTVFSLKYGLKDSLSVFVCMALLSFFLGTFYTVFYAVTEAFLGMILGTCLKNHYDTRRTQLLIMILSALFSVIGSVFLASLFGISITSEMTEVKEMIETTFTRAGIDTEAVQEVLSMSSLKRMFIISMIVLGVIQGFVIFRLSLLVLKRLQMPVPAPQPVGLYYPPRWSGYAALFLIFLYMYSMVHPLGSSQIQDLAQTLGLCAYIYLLCFGWIALAMIIRRFITQTSLRLLAGAGAFLFLFAFPYGVQILGFCYISTNLHNSLLGV